MRRLLIFIIPACILLVSVALMAGGSFLKQPMGNDDRLLEAVQHLERDVMRKDWKEAENHIDYAIKAWRKVVNRIQFSVEREPINEINGTLARIKGAVIAEDAQAILLEIYYFYDLFDGLAG